MVAEEEDAVRSSAGSVSDQELNREQQHRIRGSLFLLSVTGMSLLFGFGMTLAMAKRRDPRLFQKGLLKADEEATSESGGALAMRALARGTAYAVGGFSAFVASAWFALGLRDIKELPAKMKALMPAVPQPESTGRSDFATFRELVEYVAGDTKS